MHDVAIKIYIRVRRSCARDSLVRTCHSTVSNQFPRVWIAIRPGITVSVLFPASRGRIDGKARRNGKLSSSRSDTRFPGLLRHLLSRDPCITDRCAAKARGSIADLILSFVAWPSTPLLFIQQPWKLRSSSVRPGPLRNDGTVRSLCHWQLDSPRYSRRVTDFSFPRKFPYSCLWQEILLPYPSAPNPPRLFPCSFVFSSSVSAPRCDVSKYRLVEEGSLPDYPRFLSSFLSLPRALREISFSLNHRRRKRTPRGRLGLPINGFANEARLANYSRPALTTFLLVTSISARCTRFLLFGIDIGIFLFLVRSRIDLSWMTRWWTAITILNVMSDDWKDDAALRLLVADTIRGHSAN